MNLITLKLVFLILVLCWVRILFQKNNFWQIHNEVELLSQHRITSNFITHTLSIFYLDVSLLYVLFSGVHFRAISFCKSNVIVEFLKTKVQYLRFNIAGLLLECVQKQAPQKTLPKPIIQLTKI
tara:strand:+ start:1757 stop:2128 length:372 start_codon:yes stop_codon:yes gene_type:complete